MITINIIEIFKDITYNTNIFVEYIMEICDKLNANKIITNMHVGYFLQESSLFKPHKNFNLPSLKEPGKMGKIIDVKIFVDPNLKIKENIIFLYKNDELLEEIFIENL